MTVLKKKSFSLYSFWTSLVSVSTCGIFSSHNALLQRAQIPLLRDFPIDTGSLLLGVPKAVSSPDQTRLHSPASPYRASVPVHDHLNRLLLTLLQRTNVFCCCCSVIQNECGISMWPKECLSERGSSFPSSYGLRSCWYHAGFHRPSFQHGTFCSCASHCLPWPPGSIQQSCCHTSPYPLCIAARYFSFTGAGLFSCPYWIS